MTDWIPSISAFTRVFNALRAGMSGGAVLNRSRVAGSALTGQTQSRERHHADVRFDLSRFAKAPPCPHHDP
jgi:hypothetical protein